MSNINWNDEQRAAIDKVVRWYFLGTHSKQLFLLFGYAGTGKTTLVKHTIDILGLPDMSVVFATLTGKAALVLRYKGNNANTVHRTFYTPFKVEDKVKFRLKGRIEENIKLIVIDEFSMINDKMLDDILSFNIPVLAIGDPGQLKPVFGCNRYTSDSSLADVLLTNIMRQNDESGILDLAFKARNKETIKSGIYKKSRVCHVSDIVNRIEKFDMVLCFKNVTRELLIRNIRCKLGYTKPYPQKGEKLVCLRNNYNHNIDYNEIVIYPVNGLLVDALTTAAFLDDDPKHIGDFLRLQYTPDFMTQYTDDAFNTTIYKHIFDEVSESEFAFNSAAKYKHLSDDDKLIYDEAVLLQYGYALSVHKSQGSEWGNVLLLAYDHPMPNDIDGYSKFLYTGITRAMNSITIAYS